MKRQITNNECLRGNATRIRQSISILVSHDACFFFQVKSWSDSTFCCFVHWELVSTLSKKSSSRLSGNNTKFSELSVDSTDSLCRENPRNRRKFLNLEAFSFFFIEVVKVLFWYVKYIITNVWEALPQEFINFYQFLHHVTLVVLFQLKSWSDSTFRCFVHWELVETLLKDNPAFYLVII